MKDQENTQKGIAMHKITNQALSAALAIELCILAILIGLTAGHLLEIITK